MEPRPGRGAGLVTAGGRSSPTAGLAYGSFRPHPAAPARVGIRDGDEVVDLRALHEAGLLAGLPIPPRALCAPRLDGLLAQEPPAWEALLARLEELLAPEGAGAPAAARHRVGTVALELPFTVADYVDFYASEHHALALGRILRPGQDPLPASWRHIPLAYHGRSSTVRASGAPVRRPRGVRSLAGGAVVGDTEKLDLEVELGAVMGGPPADGSLAPERARARVFGYVIVNDWSARDIQRVEYAPLGPFLGKSFLTSISAWVVPARSLAAHLVPAPAQDPPPPPHLREDDRRVLDLALEVELTPAGGAPAVVARTNARHLYWTVGQMVAHLTSNGCGVAPGDLYASGTISGPGAGEAGSLIELSQDGARPVPLADGAVRTFLEDGDTVTIRGVAGSGPGALALGEVTGTVLPAVPS